MSTETILAVAFLVVAAASLAVHVGTLILITRDGAGEWLPIGYRRVTNTLRIRVFGAALYTATGLVAVSSYNITAPVAFLVFAIMAALYAVSSIRDCRYWRTQRGQERRAGGHHGPGTPRRATGGRHSRARDAGAHRTGRPRSSTVQRAR